MTKRRVVALAGVLVLVLVLAWTGTRPREGTRDADAPEPRSARDDRDEPEVIDDTSAPDPSSNALAGRPPAAGPRSELPQVRGHVVDDEEGPLAEGSVLLACEDGEAIGRAAIDEEGWFEGPACPRGPTCARLVHPGSRQREAWRLTGEGAHALTSVPAPRVAGIVRAASGTIEGAELFVRRGEARWATRSEPDGAFVIALGDTARAAARDPCRIDGVEGEPFSLTVIAPDLAPALVSVPTEGDDALDVVLAAAAAPLRGRLLDPNDRPFARARVLARSLARPDEAHALEPDAAGEFAFTSLGEGRYELRAIRDGVELARSESEAGANVVMRATLAARGPTLVLRVHDEEGTPCTRMRVDGGPFRMAWTDTEGQVEAPDVFSGSLALSLRPESAGSGIRETIQVPLGEQGRRIEVDLAVDCEG